MKVRGMKIVGDKLSKGTVTKRLKKLFGYSVTGGLHRKGAIASHFKKVKKQLDKEFAEMMAKRVKMRPPMTEWTEEDVLKMIRSHLLTGSPSTLQKDRKKFKTQIVKCYGTSRKKCPKCKDKGKIKIWQNCFHEELLCIRCGWTTRVIPDFNKG